MEKKRKSILVSEELHRALDNKRGELGLRTFTELLLYLLTVAKNK